MLPGAVSWLHPRGRSRRWAQAGASEANRIVGDSARHFALRANFAASYHFQQEMLDQAPIPTLLNMESALSAKNGAFSPTARSHCRASVHAKRTQSLPPRLAPVITPVRTNCLILLSPIIHILAVQMHMQHD